MTAPQNPTPQPQGAGVGAPPPPPKISFFEAFKPEPAKAPPVEWVAFGVGLVLALCSLLPWITGETTSLSGLDIGDGWIVLGAGLVSMILGFVGLSRDSISLAVGQLLTALFCLIVAVINMNPAQDEKAGLGIYATIVVAIILIGLSAYNAYDALRKGAKY